jgi:hypothetical protein
MRTVPVNQSAGPWFEGCEPDLFISIFFPQLSAINHPLFKDLLLLISQQKRRIPQQIDAH